MGNDVAMEAASLTLPARREGLAASLRRRRRDRRAKRLLADAERFERAAARLEATLDEQAWQVAHLRRSAEQLRALAVAEAGVAEAGVATARAAA
jgi:hypothetical protein